MSASSGNRRLEPSEGMPSSPQPYDNKSLMSFSEDLTEKDVNEKDDKNKDNISEDHCFTNLSHEASHLEKSDLITKYKV